jgi:hypothetical protein
MDESGESLVAFLGVPADREVLGLGLEGLPDSPPAPVPVALAGAHKRLVVAGSLMTAVSLIGGGALALYGIEQLLFGAGGAAAAVMAVIGLLLAGTHWGWVHVAEYIGLGIDQRQERTNRERADAWLATVSPYPRFAVTTRVLADASTSVERVSFRPVLTPQRTFTFDRLTEGAELFDADAAAQTIAGRVETLRREARLKTDRRRELWEAGALAYAAALSSADDDREQIAAKRAAALALSQHLNASLREPPLAE